MVRSALNVPATGLPSPLRRLTVLTVPPAARTVTGVVTDWSSLPLRGVIVSRAGAAAGEVVGAAADGFAAPPAPAACAVGVDPPPPVQPATSTTSAPATAAVRTAVVPRQKPRISPASPTRQPARDPRGSRRGWQTPLLQDRREFSVTIPTRVTAVSRSPEQRKS